MAIDELKASMEDLQAKVSATADEHDQLVAERDLFKGNYETLKGVVNELDSAFRPMWEAIDGFSKQWDEAMDKLGGLKDSVDASAAEVAADRSDAIAPPLTGEQAMAQGYAPDQLGQAGQGA